MFCLYVANWPPELFKFSSFFCLITLGELCAVLFENVQYNRGKPPILWWDTINTVLMVTLHRTEWYPPPLHQYWWYPFTIGVCGRLPENIFYGHDPWDSLKRPSKWISLTFLRMTSSYMWYCLCRNLTVAAIATVLIRPWRNPCEQQKLTPRFKIYLLYKTLNSHSLLPGCSFALVLTQ